jgi:hypothetical protein
MCLRQYKSKEDYLKATMLGKCSLVSETIGAVLKDLDLLVEGEKVLEISAVSAFLSEESVTEKFFFVYPPKYEKGMVLDREWVDALWSPTHAMISVRTAKKEYFLDFTACQFGVFDSDFKTCVPGVMREKIAFLKDSVLKRERMSKRVALRQKEDHSVSRFIIEVSKVLKARLKD